MYQTVHRCRSCKSKCPQVVENALRTSSRCVLVEANHFTRKAAGSELEEKVKVWGNAAPPLRFRRPMYPIDLIALEHAKFLKNGSMFLKEVRKPVPMKFSASEESTAESSDSN